MPQSPCPKFVKEKCHIKSSSYFRNQRAEWSFHLWNFLQTLKMGFGFLFYKKTSMGLVRQCSRSMSQCPQRAVPVSPGCPQYLSAGVCREESSPHRPQSASSSWWHRDGCAGSGTSSSCKSSTGWHSCHCSYGSLIKPQMLDEGYAIITYFNIFMAELLWMVWM